jgi:hypothetical protein
VDWRLQRVQGSVSDVDLDFSCAFGRLDERRQLMQ